MVVIGSKDEVSAVSRWPPMLRAFRNRYFRWFYYGQAVSLIGTWIQNIAQSWLIFKLTGSPAMLGAASFVNLIPGLVFSPLGGVVADRFDRRQIILTMLCLQAALALLLAILTLSEIVQIWHILVMGFFLGTSSAFEIPARQSMVFELVEREDLSNAIALNTTAFNATRVIGPGIAAVLVGLIGEGWCFLVNALSFVPVIAGLYFIRVTLSARIEHQAPPLNAIVEGFRYFLTSPALRCTVVVVIGIGIGGNSYATLMPIFANDVLHGGVHSLGWLMSSAGFGAMLGALGLASLGGQPDLHRWIRFGAIGLGICLVLFSWSTWLLASMVLLVGMGLCTIFGTTSANMLFQSVVPDVLRGRAVSIYIMVLMGSTPIGALIGGALAELIGAPATTTLGGLLCIGAGLWYGRRMREFQPQQSGIGDGNQ